MSILALKLLLTPTLMLLVSLAGRRWGAAVSGLLAGLPLTTGPVLLILAITQGPRFVATAAASTLLGVMGVIAFCLVTMWLALRHRWAVAMLAGWGTFTLAVGLLQWISLALPFISLFILLALLGTMRLMPTFPAPAKQLPLPWWDLPLRMAIAASMVVLLTGVAPLLGPRISGLLSPFPVFTAILGGFAHHFQGPQASANVLRGTALAMFSFSAFCVVVAALVVPLGWQWAFASSAVMTLSIQGGLLVALRKTAEVGR